MNKYKTIVLFIFLLFSPLMAQVPLPVEVQYFSAEQESKYIKVLWGTATEEENHGFNIERADVSMNFSTVGFVYGHGTSYAPIDYSFIDTTVVTSGTYTYRLEQIDNNGGTKYHNTLAVVKYTTAVEKTETIHPAEFNLSDNYPNPFNPSTTFSFSIGIASHVELSVFNMLGQETGCFIDEYMLPGSYKISASFDGMHLSSGTYICRLVCAYKGGTYVNSKKLLYLK
jgi:hypothetical protein